MMSGVNSVSNLTRRNWLIDAGLLLSALIAMLSGVYFLYIPSGGYQGGRNPLAQLQIIFERHTWEDLHTWGGIVMVAVATIHLILHWSWFTAMTRRTIKELRGQCGCMNARGRWNLWINVLVAVSFILVAISGLYFFFFPGNKNLPGSTVIFSWNTWDLIHTWSGIVLTSAAVLHFAIHWKWVTKVTRNMWLVATQPVRQSEPAPQRSTHLSQS
jgi:hypothetical protein